MPRRESRQSAMPGAALNSVALVTMTWARTRSDEELLLRSLSTATTLGLPIVIADRNGPPEFVERLSRLSQTAVVPPRGEGLVLQITAAFDAAAACAPETLFYSEPDKEMFFAGAAARLLERARHVGGPALVLAARSEASFATFPPMQRYTESIVNHLCGDLLGVGGDYSYGPFLMPRRLLSKVTLPPNLGWGWRFAAFRAARCEGLPIVHVPDDLPCPVEQRDEDDADRVHRVRQLSENLLGLITGA
jgi:hypothetical protein